MSARAKVVEDVLTLIDFVESEPSFINDIDPWWLAECVKKLTKLSARGVLNRIPKERMGDSQLAFLYALNHPDPNMREVIETMEAEP